MSTVLWFTGLSGSGKTTIAEELKKKLEEQGKRVCILDGDAVRATLHKNLGFGREDIRENNRLIAELAKEKSKTNDLVLVPIISPYREDRDMARKIVGDGFLEIFVDCPLSVCEKRDVKGLYIKARRGEIDNFIGVSKTSPYEKPLNPDVVIKTDEMSVEEGVASLLEALRDDNPDIQMHPNNPDVKRNKLLYPELSYQLNGIFFAVHNELGRFRNEKQYADAVERLLREKQILYEREYTIPRSFKGEHIRRNIVDFLIDNKVIVEIKAKTRLEKTDYYQLLRYLNSLDLELGFLVNFRRRHLAPKRILNAAYSDYSDK